MISVTPMKRKKREILNQNKNDVTQHVIDGAPISTSKDIADYDWLKARGTIMIMRK